MELGQAKATASGMNPPYRLGQVIIQQAFTMVPWKTLRSEASWPTTSVMLVVDCSVFRTRALNPSSHAHLATLHCIWLFLPRAAAVA